jgi:hypothetical protein
MAKRLRIVDHQKSNDYISLDFLEASNKAEFLENIQDLVKDFSDDAKFVMGYGENYQYLEVTSFRDETDKEMEKRLLRRKNATFRAKQAREKAKADETMEERRELQRLLAKYKSSIPKNIEDETLEN